MDNWNKLYVFLTIWEEIVINELEKKQIEQDYLNFINSISVKQFENIQEYKNSIKKYRDDPILFYEESLGIKLFEY